MAQEEIRKGPWTEQEDLQLACFVGLFGDRRWDFIAKVSGLRRTGKSCRLRWVNYLHPGLKRGKMTPHEERLVLELHSQWGNRWSRIAGRLPGRTDNEIKNYWRTHLRKLALEKKREALPLPLPSSASRITYSSKTATEMAGSFQSIDISALQQQKNKKDEELFSMDDIWKDIITSCPPMASPMWEY